MLKAANNEGGGNKKQTVDSKGPGLKALGGDRDGTIEVCMTWLVRRDIFEVPVMIVMNVSSVSIEFGL